MKINISNHIKEYTAGLRDVVEKLITDCVSDDVKKYLYDVINEKEIKRIISLPKKEVTKYELEYVEKTAQVLKSLFDNSDLDELIIPDALYDDMVVFLEKFNISMSGSSGTKQLQNNMEHEYPELKGSTDKAKYIYNKDVLENESNPTSVESFIEKVYKECKLVKVEKTEISISLKYDGASVITTEKNKIKKAITRGKDGLGSDITKIIRDLRIYDPVYQDEIQNEIGVKNEILLSKSNLDVYNELTKSTYKNTRSAINSILNNPSYAYLLTLVPIDIMDRKNPRSRKETLELLNKIFKSEIEFHFNIFKGDINDLLEIIHQYYNAVLSIRPELPYDIDGLVIEFIDEKIRKKMGRKNDINKYEIALKFPSEEFKTVVEDLTYDTGGFGKVTPMIHYKLIKFSNGSKHTKSSLGSYGKFKEMKLRKGDIVNVKYVNDVICHVTKDFEASKNNDGELFVFGDVCSTCGCKLQFSEKEARCINDLCDSRQVGRVINFLNVFKIRGVKNKTIEKLFDEKIVTSIMDLINIRSKKYEFIELEGLGEKSYVNLASQIKEKVLNPDVFDYIVLASLGISDISEKTAMKICEVYTLDELLTLFNSNILEEFLVHITDIGEKKASKINEFLKNKYDEVKEIISNIHIKNYKENKSKMKVRMTGFRNKELVERCKNIGIDIGEGDPTKDTDYLLIKEDGYESKKTKKAKENGINIITLKEFEKMIEDME